MRLLFAATPDIALPTLQALVEAGWPVAVLTNPDAAVGRSSQLQPSPVKALALSLGLTVYQPAKLDAAFRQEIAGQFDLLVSFAFGKIFGPKFLELFPQGGLNIHPSLLPRWRGPSPLNAAIVHRDPQTGLSIQRLALEMDCGDLLYQDTLPLTGIETAASLTTWAAQAAPPALLSVLGQLKDGTAVATPQDSTRATYCKILSKDDGRLDWSQPAAVLDAQRRGLQPWPGVWTTWKGLNLVLGETEVWTGPLPTHVSVPAAAPPGTIVGVDKKRGILVQTGDGLLAVRSLQLQAKKMMDHLSFLNGNRDFTGSRLGENE